jgi:hypothetical protein
MEVGRRAERAEAEFWAGYARNVTLTDENRFTGAIPVAGGFAICFQGTKNDYGLGVGSTRALRADDLRIVDEFYWARGLPSSLEVHPDVLERDGALLTSWGYRPVETVAVLEVDLGALPTAAPGITIEPMSGRRAEWIELVTSGFDDVSDAQALRHAIHISAAAATELVGARIGGRLAGGGALGMVRDGALLYSGSVLPAMVRSCVRAWPRRSIAVPPLRS